MYICKSSEFCECTNIIIFKGLRLAGIFCVRFRQGYGGIKVFFLLLATPFAMDTLLSTSFLSSLQGGNSIGIRDGNCSLYSPPPLWPSSMTHPKTATSEGNLMLAPAHISVRPSISFPKHERERESKTPP